MIQVESDKRLSAKEILEARWFTEDIETVKSALEVTTCYTYLGSNIYNSIFCKVMELNELDSVPNEEEVDREDSGEDHYLVMIHLP